MVHSFKGLKFIQGQWGGMAFMEERTCGWDTLHSTDQEAERAGWTRGWCNLSRPTLHNPFPPTCAHFFNTVLHAVDTVFKTQACGRHLLPNSNSDSQAQWSSESSDLKRIKAGVFLYICKKINLQCKMENTVDLNDLYFHWGFKHKFLKSSLVKKDLKTTDETYEIYLHKSGL